MSLSGQLKSPSTLRAYVLKIIEQDRTMPIAIFLAFMISVIVIAMSIPRGIGFHDESWYLILMRDGIAACGSSWPLFFTWIPDNIIGIRITTVALIALGNIVLGYCLYAFFKDTFNLSKSSIILLSMIAFWGSFSFGHALSLVPAYARLNLFIFQIGLGLALLSVKNEKNRKVCAFFSGFSLGFLFFVMPTNTPIIIIVGAFIFLSEKTWGSLISFATGTVSALATFFSLIQTPSEFYLMVQQTTQSIDAGHGIKPMIKWSVLTLKYALFDIFLFSVFIYFLRVRWDNETPKKDILTKIVVFLLLVYFITPFVCGYLRGVPRGIYPADTLAILFGWVVLENWNSFNLRNKLALLLLIVAPFFASIGTDVPFAFRGIVYMGVFYGTMIFVLSLSCAKFRIYFYLVLLLVTIGFICNFFTPNWCLKENLSKNNTSISSIGINKKIFISKNEISILKDMKNYIGESKNVVISDQSLWGFVYLLDLKPFSYQFRYNELCTITAIKKSNTDNFIIIEAAENAFSELFWDYLKGKWEVDNSRKLDYRIREFSYSIKIYRLTRVNKPNHSGS